MELAQHDVERLCHLPTHRGAKPHSRRILRGRALQRNTQRQLRRHDALGSRRLRIAFAWLPRLESHGQLHVQRPPWWMVDVREHRQCQIRDLGWIPRPRVSGFGRCALRLLTNYPQSCENPGFFVEKSGFFMSHKLNPEGAFHPIFTGRIFRDVRREQESWANGI